MLPFKALPCLCHFLSATQKRRREAQYADRSVSYQASNRLRQASCDSLAERSSSFQHCPTLTHLNMEMWELCVLRTTYTRLLTPPFSLSLPGIGNTEREMTKNCLLGHKSNSVCLLQTLSWTAAEPLCSHVCVCALKYLVVVCDPLVFGVHGFNCIDKFWFNTIDMTFLDSSPQSASGCGPLWLWSGTAACTYTVVQIFQIKCGPSLAKMWFG